MSMEEFQSKFKENDVKFNEKIASEIIINALGSKS